MRILSMFAAAVLALALALALAPAPAPAKADGGADVRILDRVDGRELPVYFHKGQRYVVGQPGHEYDIRIRNRSGQRVLAVTSVDGVNVVSGQTANFDQAGYVLGPHQETRIDGWRKNLSAAASFYFTQLPNSYAARTGRPGDVGVVGVALFREEAPRCCAWFRRDEQRVGRADAQASVGSEKADTSAANSSAPRARSKPETLGTGHGRLVVSNAREVEFQRAATTPDEVIAIYYDSRANLIAQGVVPRPPAYAQRTPQPFPESGFVPDP